MEHTPDEIYDTISFEVDVLAKKSYSEKWEKYLEELRHKKYFNGFGFDYGNAYLDCLERIEEFGWEEWQDRLRELGCDDFPDDYVELLDYWRFKHPEEAKKEHEALMESVGKTDKQERVICWTLTILTILFLIYSVG